jgi:hypothetical protein
MNTATLPSVAPVESVEEIWGASLRPGGCPRCGQAHLVEPARMGGICPNCMEGGLEPQPALLREEEPEQALPFRLDRQQLLGRLTEFSQGVWLRADDFNPESLLRQAVPVYIPMWLVDGEVGGDWRAEVGFDYQVKSSQEAYQGSSWQSQEVIETRVRWETRVGQISRKYNNIAAPAVSDHAHFWKILGGWPLDKALPYQTQALKTALGTPVLRVPDLHPESAWPLAEMGLKKAAASDCYRASGAQHVRNFALHPEYQDLHWTQLLLPVFVSCYSDDEGKPQLVYINGMTGTMGGIRLASQRKGWLWAGILGGSGVLLFLLALLAFAATMILPPLALVGALLAFIALVLTVAGITAAAWPWQWNRGQQAQKVIRR